MGDVFGIGSAIGGTVQAAGQLGAAGMQMAAQYDYNNKYIEGVRATNEANRLAAEQQNRWNKQQWLDEIAYNDPAKQVQRLRNAGLSAAAAAQNIEGAGNAMPLQSADLSVYQAPQPLQAPSFDVSGLNLIGLAREIEDLRQAKLLTQKQGIEMDFEPSRLFTEQQIREQQLLQLQQDYNFAAEANPYRLRGLQYDVKTKVQGLREAKLRYKIARFNLKSSRNELGFLEKIRPVQLEQAFASLAKIYSEIDNSEKQGKLLDQTFARNAVMSAFDKFGGVPDSFAGRMAILIASGKLKPEDIQANIRNFTEMSDYLIKGLVQPLGRSAVDLLHSLVFGDKQQEDDASMVRALQKRWKIKNKKYKNASDAPMGARLESAPFDE